MKFPPQSKKLIANEQVLVQTLKPLIGQPFCLTGKARTDGSNIRKLITKELKKIATPIAVSSDYSIIPPKSKGVPKILTEIVDSYIVTTGHKYNLQIWNRNPSIDSILVEYSDPNEKNIMTTDVRYIFTKVNPINQTIETIVILTGKYIIEKFGEFGVPTVKEQFILSNQSRKELIEDNSIIEKDTETIKKVTVENAILKNKSIKDKYDPQTLLSMEALHSMLKNKLIGLHLDNLSTKNRGQTLELIVAELLGYDVTHKDTLSGNYPDINHQLLEVKVQDSYMIDLGKYSPQNPVNIVDNISTLDVRYLIALTNENTSLIEGILLTSGSELGKYGTYIAEKSFKCQKTIPMSFFDGFKGKVVYNP
ncbi:nuclease [Macrococcoides caseolyticum]|uniref:nuclease n=1 Tax=Macrococcoides caseolyticum TaxID=69966 RepID=UPI000C321183|nr:nuclease [Macrococcus caseolyticus]PKE65713.1 nuclease [Macrococcus caseolyticus]